MRIAKDGTEDTGVLPFTDRAPNEFTYQLRRVVTRLLMANCARARGGAKVAISGLLVAVLFAGSALTTNRAAQAATPSFVQGTQTEITSGTTNAVPFAQANTAGNLIA